MRILVTNNGKKELKDISVLQVQKPKTDASLMLENSFTFHDTMKSKSRSRSNKSNRSRGRHSKSPKVEDMLQYALTDGNNFNNDSSFKIIEVKQKKIDVPKTHLEKFNKVDTTSSSILPNLPLNIIRKEHNHNSFMYNKLDDFGVIISFKLYGCLVKKFLASLSNLLYIKLL